MKKWIVLVLLLVAAVVVAEDEKDTVAPECDPEACELPHCRCSTTDIPGGLNARDVPQFVTLAFNEAINLNNLNTFRQILYDRQNSNGCSAGATFFVNHEYNNYQGVNELYNRGFEIALNSISHQVPQGYWAEISYEDMVLEIVHQRTLMTHFANIPFEAMKGVRLPFLQMSGNTSFQVMADHDLLYDNSWPTVSFTDPALWPYTLAYRSTQDCNVPPCPAKSIPGPWVMPMVAWLDLAKIPCTFMNSCFYMPDTDDENAWYNFIITNFERHYKSNKAPFPINVNEWFLSSHLPVRNAFIRFLNLINQLDDVFMVNLAEVLDWMTNPVPINEYRQQPCKTFLPTSCSASSCGPLLSSHSLMPYYMQTCNVCPASYPWVGNPLGF